MSIKKAIKRGSILHYLYLRFVNHRAITLQKKYGDKELIRKKWRKRFGYDIDLNNPSTLNEKIQWLKLNDRQDIYTVWADKYGSRDYIKEHFGEEYLVPLLFKTDNPKDINENNVKEFPCVIKANHSSGTYLMLKTKNSINWKRIQRECKAWLKQDYYACSQEWQYKNIKRYIIVEKMLLGKNGKIPNDYKLHFIDGKLIFIYCSIDREGDNYRQIYDCNWNKLYLKWDSKNETTMDNHPAIPKPKCFDKMLEIGKHFATIMHYVRVDFYEVDGRLYCGEITLHHGSGFDKFYPEALDLTYGKMLQLPVKK